MHIQVFGLKVSSAVQFVYSSIDKSDCAGEKYDLFQGVRLTWTTHIVYPDINTPHNQRNAISCLSYTFLIPPPPPSIPSNLPLTPPLSKPSGLAEHTSPALH